MMQLELSLTGPGRKRPQDEEIPPDDEEDPKDDEDEKDDDQDDA